MDMAANQPLPLVDSESPAKGGVLRCDGIIALTTHHFDEPLFWGIRNMFFEGEISVWNNLGKTGSVMVGWRIICKQVVP